MSESQSTDKTAEVQAVDQMAEHVGRALDLSDDDEVRYHLRTALQYPAVVREELDIEEVPEVVADD